MNLKRHEKTNHSSLSVVRIGQLTMMAFVLLIGFQLHTSSVHAAEETGTIHHVYVDDEYVGAVSEKGKLDDLLEEKLQKAEKKYKKLPITVGDNVSVVSEKVFDVQTDDDAVMKQLQKEVQPATEAVGVKVGKDLVLYVQNDKQYKQLLREYKLQYVTKKQLNAYEKNNKKTTLKAGKKRITNVKFTKNLDTVDAVVQPKEVLSVDQAVKYLNKGTLKEKKYTIKAGDVLGSIAQKHDMKTADLIKLNKNLKKNTVLQIDDELNVTETNPIVEVAVNFESKKNEKIPYKKVEEEDPNLPKGEKEVKTEGKEGKRVITETIQMKNGQVVKQKIKKKKLATKAIDEVIAIGTKEVVESVSESPDTNENTSQSGSTNAGTTKSAPKQSETVNTPSRGSGQFTWPASGGYVSSQMGARWGRQHNGIDIARPSNRSIKAADSGVVAATGPLGGFGNRIVIDHGNGYQTLYAHLASIQVSPGQKVGRGSQIGVMGSTGNSTGVHLHFEVRKNGSLINPLSVLR